MDSVLKDYKETSWDYRTANTKTLTHCFHSYPAMMIPQVAGRLIETYGKNKKLLFDPYCGTGTSLVEANLRGIKAVGTDLNPLARIIAKTKTTPISKQTLEFYLKDFNDKIFHYRFGLNKSDSIVLPTFKNIDYWFTVDVQEKLSLLKEYIRNIEDFSVRQFFKVAFSETVRESSLTKNSEFKLFRMKPNQRENFNPDVFGIMETKLSRNRNGLYSLMAEREFISDSKVFSFNTVEGIPEKSIEEDSIDIVVTSPPYGDSRTTVAYGQYSRLANQWMGYEEAGKLDNELMGGKKIEPNSQFNSNTLNEKIDAIGSKDSKRVKDVVSFYVDYQKSIRNISKVVKKGGFASYIVGNRRVKDETLPTDEITREFFEDNGFQHIDTHVRNIPHKRMPARNSPTNVVGKLSTTMNHEYIVVMQKR
tara:strand:+ start:1780 stop:3039 length:1260 start_codon:yes stop_codon:yes gene_type:complete